MKKNLVIVESPAKAKTIEKFLGEDYKVLSSFGHIRDLKKKELGIDINDKFQPHYEVPEDKKKVVGDLKKAAKQAEVIWLASDEDREGEAISWHLFEELNLEKKDTKRIVFHEITKSAILHAIENPRSIDINLVNAQQARRVLDRIVGFELSPVLWKKIKPSLSAGRVQSVTVRLVVEREREIQNFKAERSFRVVAQFLDGDKTIIKAELKNRIKQETEAAEFLAKCKDAIYTVENIETKPATRTPAPPFTTSTLQQEAARKFGFTVATTMRIAQTLYESGKITYMRTDSVNLSDLALSSAKQEIISMAGTKYHKSRRYANKSKGAQEAHEAIRPTYISNHAVDGTAQEKKLYDLIWKRTIASQMADAQLEKTTITIGLDNVSDKFITTGEVIKFDGFLKVYIESSDDEKEETNDNLIPKLNIGETLTYKTITAQEKYSQKPARYTEATLVRKLEELGIGRPSTYAPTISTIQNREYVERKDIPNIAHDYTMLTLSKGEIKTEIATDKATIDKNKLSPTDIGIVVNDFLYENFPNIMDYNFTASVEEQFDNIAEGNEIWNENISSFYERFHPNVELASSTTGRKAGERELGIDPVSGKPVFVKIGRYGAIAQIGEVSSEEKPRFASLRTGQSLETIGLEEALELFKLPLHLGEYDGEAISVAIGRFGPYVKHGKGFISIPKEEDPLSVTQERAIELIEEKRTADRNKVIKIFADDDIQILNGRYGAYITHAGANYKIPKGMVAADLNLEDCKAILADDKNKAKTKTKAKGKK